MPTKRLFMGISYMIFRKLLVCSKKQDPKSRLFSIWGPDIITQKLNTIKLLLFTLLEVSAKIITNSRHHIIKNSRSHHIVILSKSKKNLEVIQMFTIGLETICVYCLLQFAETQSKI